MPPPRSLPCARNRTPAAGPRPRRRGAAGGPSLAPLFGDLTFFQYLRTHHHHLGVGRRYRRETGSEQGMGPGRRGGGRDRQPLVCTARSLCVRAQCVCATSSPTMPSPSLAASEAAITCAPCSRWSRRWEAAEGDVGGGLRLRHMLMISMSRVGSTPSRAVPVTRRAPTGSPAPPSCLMPAVSPEPKREMMRGGQLGPHRGDGSTRGSRQAGCNTQTAEMNAASGGHVQRPS